MRTSCASRCPQFVSGLRQGFVLLALASVAACSDPSGPGERIAEQFSLAIRQSIESAFQTGPTEIVVLRSDGSIEATIPCPAPCNQPIAWSRDGRKLSLTGRAPGRSVLFVVNRDGTGLREVASVDTFHAQINIRGVAEAYFPPFEEDWSSDGRLVYMRTWADGHAIETVSDDGSNRDTVFTRTLPPFSYLAHVRGPRWRPRNAAISFLNDTILSIIDADGRNLRALSDTVIPLVSRYNPVTGYVWSPDGRMVAFSLRGQDVMVHDMAEGITRKIFSNTGLGRNVCWSPSSDRLAFAVSGPQNTPDAIVTVSPDGSGLREEMPDLAPDYAHHRSFGWSPDGTYLVYQTYDNVPTGSGRILARHLISGRDIKIGDMDFRKSFVIETPGCYSLP